MQSLIGQKKNQSQRFLENGKRIPVTLIDVNNNTVVSIKTLEKDKYQAVQLGFSMKKNSNKAELGHAKGAKLEKAPKFLREVRIVDDSETLPEIGLALNPFEVFTPGDIINVSGISKGKGFQGGVKRHGFAGGPKTHGQSDRHRAPGSIGQGTTPGRVYRGKKMAGRMGVDNVTVENLEIVGITNDGVLIVKGLVPGITNGILMVQKVGEDKKFVPLQKTQEELEAEAKAKAEEEKLALEAEEKAKVEAEKAAKEAPVEEVKVESAESTEEVEAPAEDSTEQASEATEVAEVNDEAVEEPEAKEEKAEDTKEESEEVKDGDK
jgi:large subunit ribosomal protein L3